MYKSQRFNDDDTKSLNNEIATSDNSNGTLYPDNTDNEPPKNIRTIQEEQSLTGIVKKQNYIIALKEDEIKQLKEKLIKIKEKSYKMRKNASTSKKFDNFVKLATLVISFITMLTVAFVVIDEAHQRDFQNKLTKMQITDKNPKFVQEYLIIKPDAIGPFLRHDIFTDLKRLSYPIMMFEDLLMIKDFDFRRNKPFHSWESQYSKIDSLTCLLIDQTGNSDARDVSIGFCYEDTGREYGIAYVDSDHSMKVEHYYGNVKAGEGVIIPLYFSVYDESNNEVDDGFMIRYEPQYIKYRTIYEDAFIIENVREMNEIKTTIDKNIDGAG